MDKQELREVIEHQQKMTRILRSRLQQRELQEAQYGINVPPEITTEIIALSDRIQSHEKELRHLRSLAVEDQIPLVEAEYRVLLAQAWDTPEGRPSFANAANLELSRLRLGITPQQANEMEQQVRLELANEAFYKINYEAFKKYEGASRSTSVQGIEAWRKTFDLDPTIIQQFLDTIKQVGKTFTGTIYLYYEQLPSLYWKDKIILQHLGRAICLDPLSSVKLFINSLPPNRPTVTETRISFHDSLSMDIHSKIQKFFIGQCLLPLDIAALKDNLLVANNIWDVSGELSLFECFINSLETELKKWKSQDK